jgi:hypothetical protein
MYLACALVIKLIQLYPHPSFHKRSRLNPLSFCYTRVCSCCYIFSVLVLCIQRARTSIHVCACGIRRSSPSSVTRAPQKKRKKITLGCSLSSVCAPCAATLPSIPLLPRSFHTSPSALLPYLSPIARILNLFFCRLFVSIFISYFLFLSIY